MNLNDSQLELIKDPESLYEKYIKARKTEFMIMYIIPISVAETWSTLLGDCDRRNVKRPLFKDFYADLADHTKSQIEVIDLEKNPIQYVDMEKHLQHVDLRSNWQRRLPERGRRPLGFKGRQDQPEYINRIQEDGVIYEGDDSMWNSIETFYAREVRGNGRVEWEDRPTMKEWYAQLGMIDKALFTNVKRIEIKEPESKNTTPYTSLIASFTA